ncbi:hypothetical protein DH2020_025702 [Rehmannia glutinosa]|uniref:DC1 domain-containing protein n=1 Tax=Rehmannia glutinosa TaxID=99300 RepID=A0ABR0VZ07_REHGL
MEFRHFSHNHGLVFYQTPLGSEIHCSGCKSPGSGDAYVCWQCDFFLHGQCFRATRSLKHPSHSRHPLTLVPFPTYPSRSFFCNSCNLAGDGFSYSCSACEFDIHVLCALMPNASNPHLPHSQNLTNPIYPPPNPNPQPQITRYPPIPNNPFPNFIPTNTTLPNETPNYSAFH